MRKRQAVDRCRSRREPTAIGVFGIGTIRPCEETPCAAGILCLVSMRLTDPGAVAHRVAGCCSSVSSIAPKLMAARTTDARGRQPAWRRRHYNALTVNPVNRDFRPDRTGEIGRRSASAEGAGRWKDPRDKPSWPDGEPGARHRPKRTQRLRRSFGFRLATLEQPREFRLAPLAVTSEPPRAARPWEGGGRGRTRSDWIAASPSGRHGERAAGPPPWFAACCFKPQRGRGTTPEPAPIGARCYILLPMLYRHQGRRWRACGRRPGPARAARCPEGPGAGQITIPRQPMRPLHSRGHP